MGASLLIDLTVTQKVKGSVSRKGAKTPRGAKNKLSPALRVKPHKIVIRVEFAFKLSALASLREKNRF
jgi:hypothetical protein